MAYGFPPEIEQLVKDHMASGQYNSEDELIREALRSLGEEQEDLDAVREAVSELAAGDEGIPLDEAFDDIRKKHHISQDA